MNKVSSGLHISHKLLHPPFCMCTDILIPGLFLYHTSSEQDKTKLNWIQSQAPILPRTTHLPSSTGIQGSSCRVQCLQELACMERPSSGTPGNLQLWRLQRAVGEKKKAVVSSNESVSRIPSLGSN